MSILSSSATVHDGVFAIEVRCQAPTPCDGALVVWKPNNLPSGRLAGSNVHVAAGQTTSIAIAATPLGARLARTPGGYRGEVILVLKGYGYVGTDAMLTLTG